MTRVILISLLIAQLSWLASSRSLQPVAKVSEGLLRGTTATTRNGRTVSAFLGVPYAEAPIGNLRFRSPVPRKPWKGILEAAKDGLQCPQARVGPDAYTEDCLRLNVYTPLSTSRGARLLPVMVYIHGGAFTSGNGSSALSGPGYVLDRDVVLVTVNYRLGILGFLSTGDKEAPGNFGLKDQAEALRWVQRNVQAFGGDPRRVTLFGQSAGSASVHLHALSEPSKGLFQQYILQSGSGLMPWAFHENATYSTYARKVAELYSCPTNTSALIIGCLQKLSVAELLDTDSVFDKITAITGITWGPTNEPMSEDAFLTDTPARLTLQGKTKDCPMIVGNVRDEGLIVSNVLRANDIIHNVIMFNLEATLVQVFRIYTPAADAEELAKRVMQYYFNGTVSSDKSVALSQLTDLVTDAFFVYPEIQMLRLLSNTSARDTYFYSFEYRGTFSATSLILGNNDNVGVTHGDDLIYIFPLSGSYFGFPNMKMSETDYDVVDVMVDFWASFATTGVPSSSHIKDPRIWKPYKQNTSHLRIGDNSDPTPLLQHSYLKDRMAFWDKYLPQ